MANRTTLREISHELKTHEQVCNQRHKRYDEHFRRIEENIAKLFDKVDALTNKVAELSREVGELKNRPAAAKQPAYKDIKVIIGCIAFGVLIGGDPDHAITSFILQLIKVL